MLAVVKRELAERLSSVIGGLYGVEHDPVIEIPPRRELGDLASPAALHLARQLKKAPRAIAAEVLEVLELPGLVERSSIEGPGYLNFFLDRATAARIVFAGESSVGASSDQAPAEKVVVEQASTCLRAFHEWHAHHHLDVVATEVPLISEHHQYGGTADLIAQVDGTMCVLDFKTSANVWPEHKIQLSAYGYAWNEQHPGQPVTAYHLLRLDKQAGAYGHHAFEDLTAAWDVFLQLRRIWTLRPFLDALPGRSGR